MNKKNLHWILVIGLIFLLFHLYNLLTYRYINIEFCDLRPTHEKIYIFYKGLKVGHVRKLDFAEHHQTTIAKSVLTYKGLKLPDNTTAKLKKEKKHKKEYDFIELIYPQKPSNVLISNGAYINGETTVDVDTYMANQSADDLDLIKQNLTKSSQELEVVLSSLGELFSTLQEIAVASQNNIVDSTKNLSETARNISSLTAKINETIKQEQLNSSVSNIDLSIKNLSETTSSLHSMTGNLATTTETVTTATIPQLNSTLYRTECMIANLNEITCGIKQTLRKKFGGLRLFFGQVIQK